MSLRIEMSPDGRPVNLEKRELDILQHLENQDSAIIIDRRILAPSTNRPELYSLLYLAKKVPAAKVQDFQLWMGKLFHDVTTHNKIYPLVLNNQFIPGIILTREVIGKIDVQINRIIHPLEPYLHHFNQTTVYTRTQEDLYLNHTVLIFPSPELAVQAYEQDAKEQNYTYITSPNPERYAVPLDTLQFFNSKKADWVSRLLRR